MKVATLFRYTSDKAVPWNYTSQVVVQESQATAEQKPETSVNDIAGTGGMTHSGRCYALVNSGAKKGEESVKEGEIKIIVPREKTKK